MLSLVLLKRGQGHALFPCLLMRWNVRCCLDGVFPTLSSGNAIHGQLQEHKRHEDHQHDNQNGNDGICSNSTKQVMEPVVSHATGNTSSTMAQAVTRPLPCKGLTLCLWNNHHTSLKRSKKNKKNTPPPAPSQKNVQSTESSSSSLRLPEEAPVRPGAAVVPVLLAYWWARFEFALTTE